MTNIYKNVGERIYCVRTMRGYTREELAELAGISSKFLYEIESGKKGFSVRVLYSLCQALKINSDYLLTGEKGATYDKNLVMVLELFETDKTNKLVNILRGIYELLK